MQPPPVPRMPASGKLVSIARVFVQPGKEDRMRELIAAIRKEAEGEEEGTLTYRTTMSLEHPGSFLIFEEYLGQEPLEKHYVGKAFSAMGEALGKEDILDVARGGVVVEYFEEF